MSAKQKLNAQIEVLQSLSTIDSDLAALDEEIATSETALTGLKDEAQRLSTKLESDSSSVGEMEAAVKELVVEARQMKGQMDRSRDKLHRSRTERETMAAQRELEELRRLIRDREEEIGKLTTLVEAARRSVAETTEASSKVGGELSTNESGMAARLVEARKEREEKKQARVELSKKLPRLLFRRYDAALRKRSPGISALKGGVCTACHMSLPPQMNQRMMRREELETCPFCLRVLYITPPQPAPEQPEG